MADLGAYKENVKFSDSDAQALISACNTAAGVIDGQKGSMQSARAKGEEQFKGYFSTLFASNGATQVKDAGELSTALRAVATLTGELQKAADAEQQRREKARKWEEDQKHQSGLSSAWGWVEHNVFGQSDTPPVGPPAPPLNPVAAKPPVGTRQTPHPGSGGASSGTSSAIPDNLTSFASTTGTNDTALTTQHSAVQKAYTAFTSSCGWGSLDASSVLTAFQQFIQGNTQEATWAKVVAAAFEKAGGSGSVCTLSNAAISAALAAAHVSATRQDLTISMPTVKGGLVTSGYADDPVNTATGNFIEPETDLAFDGACSALVFTRMYNSVDPTPGAFGPGWSSWTESGLLFVEDAAHWVQPDGRHVVFPRSDDGWDRATGSSYWLERIDEGFVVSDNAGGTWMFAASGRLASFARGAGTRVDLMRDGDGRLIGLVHERARSISIEWDDRRVSAIEGSDGRRVAYAYDDAGRLTSMSGPSGTRQYLWGEESGLIEQVIDADGVILLVNGYDEAGRVAWQRSSFGRTSRYTYLPGGVTEVADTNGERANTWIADGLARLVGVIDSDGNRQSYVWDSYGDMVEATDRLGQKTVREYDDRGRLIHQVTPDGVDLQYGYDDRDRVLTVVVGAADGSTADAVTSYEYEGDDRSPSVILDPAGGRSVMVWENGLLSQVTDPTGVVLRFGYDEHGDLISTTNAVGDVARLERDLAGRVIAAVTPSGHRTTYSYDDAGVLVSRRDADGGVWRFEHTAAGRLAAVVAPDGGRTEIEYGPTGEETRSIDPLGRAITRTVDDLGNLASVQLPDGSVWSYSHDSLSRLIETVDPTGGVWSNRYDADGELVGTTDPTGVTRTVVMDAENNSVTVDDGLFASTLRLDALGRPQAVASGDDDSHTFVYDACGRVVEILDPEGALTLIQRDAAGRPTEVTDPTGLKTRYTYDVCGRLVEEIAPDGGVTRREYDADSFLARQTLPNGDAAWAKYDECGRLVQVHQPGSGTATYRYDKCGRIVSAADTWWGTRRFSYDQAGQLVAVTNGLGGVTRYEYDENGRLVRIIDPAGGEIRHEWDGMNRLVAQADPLGRVTTAGYNAAGRQMWQQSPDGRRISFEYDASGRNVALSVDGAVISTVARDLPNRTQTIQDLTGDSPVTHVMEWDRAARLVRDSRIGADGRARGMSWTYDAAGRRTSMVDAFGRVTQYHYDLAGRLDRVEHPGLGIVTLGYDSAGQLVTARTTDPSGDVTDQVWEWVDGYTAAHTITGPEGSNLTVIHRDEEGRIARITRDGVSTDYGYDLAEQLTEAITEGNRQSWSFDLNGRLVQRTDDEVTETYGYDPAGQLITEHHDDGTTTTHTYDLDGHRTRTIHSDGAVRDYEWTATGWLNRVVDKSTGGRANTVPLHSDALGRLTAAGTSTLWWDTAAPVPTLAGIDHTAVLPLGAVTGIGSQWMSPGWRANRADTADPWRVDPVLRVAGGLGLTATGTLTLGALTGSNPLEWLGARPYDPATHAFLATDPVAPVLGAGWAANPYSYAGNNPLAFSDPTGLHPLTDAELKQQTQGWLSKAWNATTNWVSHNWEYIVAGVAIAGGIALMCTGVGGPLGVALLAGSGALISGGTSIAIQKATTGKVDWATVGEDAAVGALGGAVGAGVAEGLTVASTSLSGAAAADGASLLTKAGATVLKPALVQSALSGGSSGAAMNTLAYGFKTDFHGSASGYLANAGIGFGTGAATSVVTDSVGDKVKDLVGSHVHMPQHAAGVGRHALPQSAVVSSSISRHVVGAVGTTANDMAVNGIDPASNAKAAATGLLMPNVMPGVSHVPAHAAP
ncbi:hypothetical protein GCM10027414_37540 [Humibacter ginsengiterrae]